jgi:hypothetical protein
MIKTVKMYLNYFTLCFKVLFLLKSCIPFLKRETKLSKNRNKPVMRSVENLLKVEKKSEGRKLVNRQDLLIYFLADAFSNTTPSEMKEELVDVFALLAIVFCEPADPENQQGEIKEAE